MNPQPVLTPVEMICKWWSPPITPSNGDQHDRGPQKSLSPSERQSNLWRAELACI